MRIGLVLLLALILAVPAWAQSVTFGSKLIVVGDSVAKVYEIAGKPDRIVPLENKFGAHLGERLEYYRNGKTIAFIVASSKVVDLSETD